MQVWKVLHEDRCKCRTQKSRQKSPSGHHPTNLSGYIFATKACVDNRKKLVKQQYLLYICPQYGELRPTSGWDRFVSLGHPGTPGNFNEFRVFAALLHGSSGRQPNCSVNRGCHLYSAGRPSRWALAHILVVHIFQKIAQINIFVRWKLENRPFGNLYSTTWRRWVKVEQRSNEPFLCRQSSKVIKTTMLNTCSVGITFQLSSVVTATRTYLHISGTSTFSNECKYIRRNL